MFGKSRFFHPVFLFTAALMICLGGCGGGGSQSAPNPQPSGPQGTEAPATLQTQTFDLGILGEQQITTATYFGRYEDFDDQVRQTLQIESSLGGSAQQYSSGAFSVEMNTESTGAITLRLGSGMVVADVLFPKHPALIDQNPTISPLKVASSQIAVNSGLLVGEPLAQAAVLCWLESLPETQSLADVIAVRFNAGQYSLTDYDDYCSAYAQAVVAAWDDLVARNASGRSASDDTLDEHFTNPDNQDDDGVDISLVDHSDTEATVHYENFAARYGFLGLRELTSNQEWDGAGSEIVDIIFPANRRLAHNVKDMLVGIVGQFILQVASAALGGGFDLDAIIHEIADFSNYEADIVLDNSLLDADSGQYDLVVLGFGLGESNSTLDPELPSSDVLYCGLAGVLTFVIEDFLPLLEVFGDFKVIDRNSFFKRLAPIIRGDPALFTYIGAKYADYIADIVQKVDENDMVGTISEINDFMTALAGDYYEDNRVKRFFNKVFGENSLVIKNLLRIPEKIVTNLVIWSVPIVGQIVALGDGILKFGNLVLAVVRLHDLVAYNSLESYRLDLLHMYELAGEVYLDGVYDPLPGIQISLEPGDLTCTTDSSGGFLFDDVLVGTYTIRPIQAPNYSFTPEEYTLTVTESRFDLDFSAELNLSPMLPTALEGAAGDSVAYLDWEPIDDTGLAGYRVYRENEQSAFEPVALVTAGEITYTDQGLVNEESYSYYVTGVDDLDRETFPSNTVTVSPSILPEGSDLNISGVDTSDYPRVVLTVSVVDVKGNPLPNLDDDNFCISEDGDPRILQRVEFVSATSGSSTPFSLSCSVDSSGSLELAGFEAEIDAVKTLADSLRTNDRMAVNIFSGSGEQFFVDLNTMQAGLQEWGSDPGQIKAQLELTKAEYFSSETDYREALYPAFDLLEAASGLKFLIFLTDGQPSTGTYDRDFSIQRALEVGSTIFTIGEGDSIDDYLLTDLAESTGGSYFQTPSPDDLEQIFETLIGRFVNVYELEYTSPLSADDNRLVYIEVSEGLVLIDHAERRFQVTGSGTGGDDYEPNNSIGNASSLVVLSSEQTQDHNFHFDGDTDFLEFDAQAGRTYHLFTTGYMDTVGYVQNSIGEELAYNDDGGDSTNFYIVWEPTSSETCYLKIREYSDNDTGSYQLHHYWQ